MNCLNSDTFLHSLIGVTLIVAGQLILRYQDTIFKTFGSYCFAFGWLLLGASVLDTEVIYLDFTNKQVLLTIGSILAIVVGTFMMHYHAQKHVANYIDQHPKLKDLVTRSLTIIDYVLVYGGFLGLVYSIGMTGNGKFNVTKGVFALIATLVISYTHRNLIQSMVADKVTSVDKITYIASWGLLVLAISYDC